MKYRAEIDGLRAIAVIPVILFHAGFKSFSGGFVGVDVFFVISGYLITTILIDDIERDRFNIITFYERRARRILPALFFVMICCMPFAYWLLTPFDLREFSQSVFATSIFSSNIYFFLKSGYFDVASELKPLLHTWSLAVEEQYYVVFPLFLCLAWRLGKKSLFWLIVIMTIVSLALSEFGWRHAPSANFYLLPTRAWELFAGSIAAFLIHEHGVRKNNLISLTGLVAILFSIFFFDHDTPFPSAYAVLPVTGVLAVVLFGAKGTITARLLSSKAFVWPGLISYSAYLWHQPLFAFTRIYYLEDLTTLAMLTLSALSLILAAFSWKFVEQPFRDRQSPFVTRKRIFVGSMAGIFFLGSLGIWGHFERGFPQRNETFIRLAQNGGLSFECSGAAISAQMCKTTPQPEIAIWGDSYAMHFVKAVENAVGDKGIHQLTLSGCPPVPGYTKGARKTKITCQDFNTMVSNYLKTPESHALKTIFISHNGDLTNTDKFGDLFAGTIHTLKKLGYRIILVTPTVRNKENNTCINRAVRSRSGFENCSFELSNASNASVFENLRNFARDADIDLVDLSEFMCNGNKCLLEIKDLLVLRDEGHLTNEIQPVLGLFFAEKLAALGFTHYGLHNKN